MFRKFSPKSRSSKILIKMGVFRKSSPTLRFLPKLLFFKILALIVIFRKFWLQSTFMNNFTKLAIFGNLDQNLDVWNKSNVLWKLCPNLKFSPILTKIAIFRNFVQNQDFRQFGQNQAISEIFSTIDIFKDFDQNGYFFEFFFNQNPDLSKVWHQLRFFENLTKINMIRKFWPKLRFSKFWSKSRDFENLHLNLDFFKILTKIAVFVNCGQIRFFSIISTSIKVFQRFWPKSRYFENHHQNRDL